MTCSIRCVLIAAVSLLLSSCGSESGTAVPGNRSVASLQDAGSDPAAPAVTSPGVSGHDSSHSEHGHAEHEHGHTEHGQATGGHPEHGHAKEGHAEHAAPGHADHRDGSHGPRDSHADSSHSAAAVRNQAVASHGDRAPAGQRSAGRRDGSLADKDKADRSRDEVAEAVPASAQAADEPAGADASSIFAQRIVPILKADTSSSCTACHFAGVELRDFIREDQAETFASLKATGMIDVENPDESKILRFISRKPEKPDPLVEKVRQAELAAFRTWIRAAVREPELLSATSDVEVGTSLPPEVIRHARKDRVLSSFIDNIWSEMGRCINCHSPERNRSKIGRNGFTKEDVDAISWIVPHDPAGTLRELVESGNIDLDDPSASPVLTKPAGLEEHGGGPKFLTGSPTYRNFLAFLTDFAAISGGQYRSAADLPAAREEFVLLSKQQLRITDIPARFGGLPLQVDIYRRNPRTGKWSDHRWATGFSRVHAKRHIWQNPVLVAAPAGSALEKEFRARTLLPPGEYRIRILIDRDRRTEKDPTYQLGDAEYVGEVKIQGPWKPGYQPPRIVKFPGARD